MKIFVDLKNCYGIKALQTDFDFSTGNAFLIYAPLAMSGKTDAQIKL